MAKRWTERLDSFTRAVGQLRSASAKNDYSELERAGLIQVFEYTFELGWKLMQDYCREQGFEVNSPREAILTALVARLITEPEGYEWLDALKQRNLLANTYDEQRSLEAEALIKQRYLVSIERLYETCQQL
ncbi:nucleotidyltransferase substrate binding protein (TIGR01987 family) [Spirosoma lacussanchae]|uniref:HI0074 family nucleotidyltransferase substrate-binding subunit n=1 Tax=Spirosoma lacussanchae TaxID=1884249 RepID=UPI0011094F14|nr:HI0074 family nucleotidyltransferase substrate-binding subunit [Spirosoma lacussanchae]